MNVKATTQATKVQGTICYLPVLVINPSVTDKGIAIRHVSHGDPLVTKHDALKYAQIWRNESLSAGYVTQF